MNIGLDENIATDARNNNTKRTKLPFFSGVVKKGFLLLCRVVKRNLVFGYVPYPSREFLVFGFR